MKKSLIYLLAFLIIFVSCSSTEYIVQIYRGCNMGTPGWGESLGVVSFDSRGHNVGIQGSGIRQVWSGAVTATRCQKTTFSGGSNSGPPDFNADCRSNPGQPGDLFSWCAVMRFADVLCPYPWRVPTNQDFIDLDIAMGGTGSSRTDLDFVTNNYIERWDVAFGGTTVAMGSGGTWLPPLPWSQTHGNHAGYWSQADDGSQRGFGLALASVSGFVDPQHGGTKNIGLSLRCVRDITENIPVTSVSLSKTTYTLGIGNNFTLVATILPEIATNQTVIWLSSNPTVAVVSNGVVVAIGAGTAIITATTQDGNHAATCIVTVPDPGATTPVISVSLSHTSATVEVGGGLVLEPTVLPANATNKNVTWSSSNINVATVSNGVVTAIGQGTAIITVATQDGNHTATSTIVIVASKGGCNTNTPGWGDSLGDVSFDSRGHNTVIQGTGVNAHITQIWSGAVTATVCEDRTSFSGGSTSNFNANCRSNPGQPGDLFSWCAVVRFADELCPYPWRIPTRQDFIDLDIAMGGTGNNRNATTAFVANNYINRWSGTFGGRVDIWGTSYWGTIASYWTQSESTAANAFILHFNSDGAINPQVSLNKGHGVSLRCVR